jgi:3-hydroxyisobutyryl-CoA hydrolase
MATASDGKLWEAQPGDEPEDVIFDSLYGMRTIQLNRPKKLNSLNGSMIRKIAPRLLEWEKSDMANVIIMKGTGEKAFCAGGDVAALAQWNKAGAEGQKRSTDYFALEYKLDHLIATYSKPFVAFMDGITMGGGVGLSIHAPLRIATERTVFAMPETTIGFFPDVGASFFLPRMPGAVGTYLALTSERLSGPNVLLAGIATHYLHSSSLPAVEARLAELQFKDYVEMGTRLKSIDATISEFATGLPYDQPMLIQGELRQAIDRCFSRNSVGEIMRALEAEQGATKDWATKTLDTLHKRSPTAVHVALRQMRIGKKWSIAETFKREHQIAAQFMRHPDFTEGVSALLIERRAPKWQPESLEAIASSGSDGSITEPFFKSDNTVKEMQLLNDRDFSGDYPHSRYNFGMPTDDIVFELVKNGDRAQREIVNYLVGRSGGKVGVKEVAEEIVYRTTRKDDNGKAAWIS